MFSLVTGVQPVGGSATSAAAQQQQEIGDGMLNPVRLLDFLRPKKCVDASKPPAEVSERVALLMKFVSERWWAIHSRSTQPGTMMPQIDVIATLKALIAAHFPNPRMRMNLYRAVVNNVDEMVDAELTEPEPAEFTRYQRAANAQMPPVSPEVWIAVFEVLRLPDSNINHSAGRLSFKEDYMLADPHTHSKPLPDTTAFVAFLTALGGQMNCAFDAPHTVINRLYHDSALLYFAMLCLMQKNAVELLRHPHFDYLDVPLGRSRKELDASGNVRQQTFREAVYTFMHETERLTRIDVLAKSEEDWQERVRPVETSWVVLLTKLCAKKYLPFTIAAPSEAPTPPVPARDEPTAPPAASATGGAAAEQAQGGAAEVAGPPEEDVDMPAAPESAAPAAPAPAASATPATPGVPEPVVTPGAATGTPATATDAEATAARISARLGPVRTRSVSESTALFAHPLLSLTRSQTQIGASRAASVLICASVYKQQPELARNLCALRGNSMLPALPRSTSEWYSALKLLDGAVAPHRANLEGVDKLARYAGWANAPADERAKRYVTVYCGADIDRLWTANGWSPPTDAQRARITQFKRVNPQPSSRTAQVLMHLAGTDEQ
jgi:hypothetical protein